MPAPLHSSGAAAPAHTAPIAPTALAAPQGPDHALAIVEPICAVFRRTLRAVGLKYTPERARILDAVVSKTAPFHAEELIAELRTALAPPSAHPAPAHPAGHPKALPAVSRVSKATVYRTIRLLQDAGIVQQIPLGAEQATYILAYGARPSGVLVHTDTGRVSLFDAPEIVALRDQACQRLGLTPHGHQFIVYAGSSSPAPHARAHALEA